MILTSEHETAGAPAHPHVPRLKSQRRPPRTQGTPLRSAERESDLREKESAGWPGQEEVPVVAVRERDGAARVRVEGGGGKGERERLGFGFCGGRARGVCWPGTGSQLGGGRG